MTLSSTIQFFSQVKSPENTTCFVCLHGLKKTDQIGKLACKHILHAGCARDYVRALDDPKCRRCYRMISREDVFAIQDSGPDRPKGFGEMLPEITSAAKSHARAQVTTTLFSLYMESSKKGEGRRLF